VLSKFDKEAEELDVVAVALTENEGAIEELLPAASGRLCRADSRSGFLVWKKKIIINFSDHDCRLAIPAEYDPISFLWSFYHLKLETFPLDPLLEAPVAIHR